MDFREMKMARIVVTGGSGVIGRALVSRLQRLGHIIVVDRRDPDQALCRGWNSDQVSFVRMDVRETKKLVPLIASADSVVHLAAASSILDFEEQPSSSFRNTVDATLSVAQAVQDSERCKTIVVASTAAVYEGQSLPYFEDQPLSPPDLKASAKLVTESVVRALHEERGKNVTVLRPFSVYSEYEMDKGMRANILSLFVWAVAEGDQPVVWGDGSQTRDFVHVDDAARAFELSIAAADGYSVFNVCSGTETSFRELLKLSGVASGETILAEYTDVRLPVYANRLRGVPTKALDVLGFRTEIPVEEGTQRVWQTVQISTYRQRILPQAHRRWRPPEGSWPNALQPTPWTAVAFPRPVVRGADLLSLGCAGKTGKAWA